MRYLHAKLAFLLSITIATVSITVAGCADDDEPVAEPSPEGGTVADALPPSTNDASGTAQPVYVDCPIGYAVESEPNDAKTTATEFTELGFCGVLEDGNAVDYSAFVTPEGKKLSLFQASINGPVDFELTVNGKTFGPADVKSFEAGAYVVKAFTNGAKSASYRYRIQFD